MRENSSFLWHSSSKAGKGLSLSDRDLVSLLRSAVPSLMGKKGKARMDGWVLQRRHRTAPCHRVHPIPRLRLKLNNYNENLIRLIL